MLPDSEKTKPTGPVGGERERRGGADQPACQGSGPPFPKVKKKSNGLGIGSSGNEANVRVFSSPIHTTDAITDRIIEKDDGSVMAVVMSPGKWSTIVQTRGGVCRKYLFMWLAPLDMRCPPSPRPRPAPRRQNIAWASE